ncbi:MAG TPA: hypothetical protein PK453_26700 [Leptospiraceae bacterium]|nr:hypothetical protein [Leptospiraceae bacterium]HNF27899.1 hypothetical protein [Leptospiraceae bacterium]HNI99743.1 hypothetical protein [Leptospiraceae bacterium]HNM06714.1 hypothetical protein [Leptospiraceae bacterium]
MRYDLLSCTFVGVWEKPFLNIQEFDRRFALDLFGDPYSTTCGLTPEGYLITKQFSPPPQAGVIINPGRIQVSEKNPAELSRVLTLVMDKLRESNPSDMLHPFSSIGINSEHVWSGLPYTSLEFFQKKIARELPVPGSKIFPYDIRMEVEENNFKFHLMIQPRNGIENAVFTGVNDDRFWSEKACPSRDQFMDLFTDSISEIRRIFEEYIL